MGYRRKANLANELVKLKLRAVIEGGLDDDQHEQLDETIEVLQEQLENWDHEQES